MGFFLGAVLFVAGLFQLVDGYTAYHVPDSSITQQLLGAVIALTGAVLLVGGSVVIVVSWGNHLAGGLKREMVGFRKDLERSWQLEKMIADNQQRALKPETGARV